MDFFQIVVQEKRGGVLEAAPDFIVGRSNDLMVRAKTFYAVWDEDKGLWSTDEYDVQRIVDSKLKSFHKENPHIGKVKYMRSFGTNGQTTFRKFMSQIGDNSHQLDEKLTFKSDTVKQKDYVSKRLPYDLAPGDYSAWDEMVGTLYKPEQREKIEWFFGAILSGDSKTIQKFLVLEGPPGAGKGTMIDVAAMLFDGYYTTFDAKALGASGNQFAAAAFEFNPLVAFQHDGDLSRIDDNTLLNSIVSHELMKINQKFKPSFDARINAALIMGTNKPVKITDAQSGLIRRLIDVHPSGIKLPPSKYHALKDKIPFQLGAIAHHCLEVYKELGKNYYSNYQPLEMMFKTNAFFNFIEAHHDVFEKEDGVSAKRAWDMYKEWAKDANLEKTMSHYAFRAEIGNYFEEFHERFTFADGTQVRSYFSGFKQQLYKTPVDEKGSEFKLALEETSSLLDLEFADFPAQYATASGTPTKKWDNVKTTLKEIDTTREHFVFGFPVAHIIADFDIKDEHGKKSLALNLEAAAKWPATYAELSRSGEGVHLHYLYAGDPTELDPNYAPGIEIKVYTGNLSLRRRVSFCNNVPIATISTGLPFKEKKRVLEAGTLKSEKALRELIARNLRKEIHPGTKPSIDFIAHILQEAYESGMHYDVSDLYSKLIQFANASTNRNLECLKIVSTMKLKSDDDVPEPEPDRPKDDREVIFDIEVYPNLFVVCWKFEEDDPKPESVVRMINPKPHEVEALMRLKLVGFNVRQYDNHILWAAALGYTVEQLYKLSQKIIGNFAGAKFGEAYGISHTDIYDYSTKKQGLKKWQIELRLPHREMDLPWDQPVPENRIQDVVDYCVNDVVSTEKVHKHLQGDWKARQILADIAEMRPNDTTAKLTSKIVFGNDRDPRREFVYTKLEKEFPGYVYEYGKSTYRDEEVGEGGYVYAEPGVHRDVVLLDVASMHPTSIGRLNLFGDKYTPRFMDLVRAQLAVKNGRYDEAKGYFEGKLVPYLEEIEKLASIDKGLAKKAAAELRYGLKIAINIVYGLTSAKFDNPFKDNRNVDNIVAKRGALFMINLKGYIQDVLKKRVVHIKTDSVKVVGATPDDIRKIMEFGDLYGYTFEHEADYDKMALVNKAVYVAHYDPNSEINRKNDHAGWTATGTQFIPEANPYVFKKLFTNEETSFDDVCETRSVVKGALYLDFGPKLEDQDDTPSGWIDLALDEIKQMKKDGASPENDQKQETVYQTALAALVHIGRTGLFTPVKPGYGGGKLWRVNEGRAYAVADTKGHWWMDAEIAMGLPDEAIDYDFFETKLAEASTTLEQMLEGSGFDTLEQFLS